MNFIKNNKCKTNIYKSIFPFLDIQHKQISKYYYLKRIAKSQTIKYLKYVIIIFVLIISINYSFDFIVYNKDVANHNPNNINNNYKNTIITENNNNNENNAIIVSVKDNIEYAEYNYTYNNINKEKIINVNRHIIIPDIIKNITLLLLLLLSICFSLIMKIII